MITETQLANTRLLFGVYASMAAGEREHASHVTAAMKAFDDKDYALSANNLSKLPDSIHKKVGNTQIATSERKFVPEIHAVCAHFWK